MGEVTRPMSEITRRRIRPHTRGIRGLYFRHYDKHLTQVFSFIQGNKVIIYVSQMRKQRLREINTSLAKLGNGEPGFESRFAQLSSSTTPW